MIFIGQASTPPEPSKGADRFWYGALFLVGFKLNVRPKMRRRSRFYDPIKRFVFSR